MLIFYLKKNFLKLFAKSNHLRIIVTLPFLLQLTLTVSIVGYLSFQNGQKTVNSIVSKLLFEIANRVEKQLEVYTSSATAINQFNQQIIVNNNLDSKSDREQKLLNQFIVKFNYYLKSIIFTGRIKMVSSMVFVKIMKEKLYI